MSLTFKEACKEVIDEVVNSVNTFNVVKVTKIFVGCATTLLAFSSFLAVVVWGLMLVFMNTESLVSNFKELFTISIVVFVCSLFMTRVLNKMGWF